MKRRGLFLLLGLAALIAACGDDGATSTSSSGPTITSTSTTSAASTTTTQAVTTTSVASDPWTVAEEVVTSGAGERLALLYRPTETPTGSAPLVVMLHGASDEPSTMSAMAELLAGDGAVVLSAYTAVAEGIGGSQIPDLMETALDDAACALAHAVDRAGVWGADPGTLMVVGHSAGADVGIYVSLAPGSFASACDASNVEVAAYVGLAADPHSMAEGGSNFPFIQSVPELVELLEPYQYLDANPGLIVRFANSADDPFRSPDGAATFVGVARAAGIDAELVLLDGRSHTAPRAPNTAAGMEVVELIRGILDG